MHRHRSIARGSAPGNIPTSQNCRNDMHTRIPPVDSSKLSTSTLASKDVHWCGVALWNNLLRLPFWMLWALRPSCSSPNSLLLGVLNRGVCPRVTGGVRLFECLPSFVSHHVYHLFGVYGGVMVFSKQSRHVQIMFVSAPLILLKPCAWAHNWTKRCHGLLLSLPTFIGWFFFRFSRFICCACFYLNGCACVPYLDRRHVVLVLTLSVPWWPTSSAARTKDPT
jgi:hypothetical protein